jgi:tRNA threonylcarbamoyl adenosine modification protein YjeE
MISADELRPPSAPLPVTVDLTLPNEAATERLARNVAMALQPGDLVTLSGDLGAGKSAFVRALVRHLADDPKLDVPSPTFTILQVYETPRFAVVHADLYRLSGPQDLAELGWDEAAAGSVVCVEWPERAGDLLTGDRLDVALTLDPALGTSARRVRLAGHGAFGARLRRLIDIAAFLDHADFASAHRTYLQGDASSRRYERLRRDGVSYVLMDAPRRPDGPPVRDGLPYSRIAHLAEDVKPFIAMAEGLRTRGFSAPEIVAADLGRGLLIVEDLGPGLVVEGDPPRPVPDRYGLAVDVLAALHDMALPAALPVPGTSEHRLPRYDMEAMLIEVELLPDWYLPHMGVPNRAARTEFMRRWRAALTEAAQGPTTWVLRDYHSPNLIWLPERDGLARIGLIDFQDAVMGPAAYDVVSLVQDARVDVSEQLEIMLLGRYVQARRAADPNFDAVTFARLYAVMGAQRATKILGIFARLNHRDGKPGYLRHLPRVWGYLARCLRHPSLGDLAGWYRDHVPGPGGVMLGEVAAS